MAQTVPQKFASRKMLQVRGKLMVGLLIVQYVVGMVLDFFIELPEKHPGTADSAYLSRVWDGFSWSLTGGGGPALATHVGIATILVLGAIATLAFSIAGHNKTWIIASSFGLLGIVLAWLNGIEFINTGLDKHSFAMAIAFMIALFSYGTGLYYAKRNDLV
jgi:hypothetical protein